MNKSKYSIGLVSVSFREHTPERILEAMTECGLKYIEWGSDIHAPCKDIERLERLSSLQKELGILCSSYGTYFRLGVTPLSELTDYIKAAKILGTNILRVWCGNKSGEEMNEEEAEALLSECRLAAEIAKNHGVILCTECHRKTFTERSTDSLRLIRELNSPFFKTYWQPFQWKSEEENLAYAEAIAPYALHVHAFQWKNEHKFPLRDGISEWQKYLEKLPAPRTVLLEFMPDGRIESLPDEAESLRRIIDESR